MSNFNDLIQAHIATASEDVSKANEAVDAANQNLRKIEQIASVVSLYVSHNRGQEFVTQIADALDTKNRFTVDEKFQAATVECLTNFKNAAYRANIGDKMEKIAKGGVLGLGACGVVAVLLLHTKLPFWPTAPALLVAVVGLGESKRLARKKFDAVNGAALKEQFIAAWQTLLFPEAIEKPNSLVLQTATKILETKAPLENYDPLNLALMQSFGREVRKYGLEQYEKPPICDGVAAVVETAARALPANTLRKLIFSRVPKNTR